MQPDEIKALSANDFFRTADFGVICALYYLGFVFDGFERDARLSERVTVYFEHSKELGTALQSLWGRELRVEPLTFLETTRAVKARLRDCI